MSDLTDQLVELIRRAATDLPPDVEAALVAAKASEDEYSAAAGALDMILQQRRAGTRAVDPRLPGHRNPDL